MKLTIKERSIIQAVHSVRSTILDQHKRRQVAEKGLADYVTQVDLAVQHQLSQLLGELYPGIQFMGEEEGARPDDLSKPLWILDPIDGTNNLIHDYKESCVSLALWDGRQVVMGVVYNPFTHETYSATLGRGARLNGREIHVSDRTDLRHSLSIVGTCPYEKPRADQVFDMIKRIYLRTEDIRRGGSAALELCRIAAGKADLYFEYNLKPWDYAAGLLIVQEAGGCCTDCSGNSLAAIFNADMVATNRLIHQELLELIRQ